MVSGELDWKLWIGFKPVSQASQLLGTRSYLRYIPMVKRGVQKGKPNCAGTFLASLQVLPANMLLAKTRHMTKFSIKGMEASLPPSSEVVERKWVFAGLLFINFHAPPCAKFTQLHLETPELLSNYGSRLEIQGIAIYIGTATDCFSTESCLLKRQMMCPQPLTQHIETQNNKGQNDVSELTQEGKNGTHVVVEDIPWWNLGPLWHRLAAHYSSCLLSPLFLCYQHPRPFQKPLKPFLAAEQFTHPTYNLQKIEGPQNFYLSSWFNLFSRVHTCNAIDKSSLQISQIYWILYILAPVKFQYEKATPSILLETCFFL